MTADLGAPRRQSLAPAVGWAILALAFAGCGGAGEQEALTVDGQRVPARRLEAAVEGLCDARAAAGGDLTRARASFYDRSHEMLHTIARALEPVDRAQAARLLEAKEAVEADLRGPDRPVGAEAAAPSPPSGIAADLDRLVEVTHTSLDRLGIEAPACPR